MANIQQRQGENEWLSGLELSGSDQIGYTLPIGNDWKTIRMGIAYCVRSLDTDTLGVTTITPTWFMGICSGTASMVKSTNCTNFVGFRWTVAGPTAAYDFATANPDTYFWLQQGGTTFYVCRKLVNTVTDTNSDAAALSMPASGSVNWYWMGEITKGTPNFTFRQSLTAYNAWTDITTTGLRKLMENPTISQTSATLLATEDSGSLDTFNIYWNETKKHRLEIAGVVVRRIE